MLQTMRCCQHMVHVSVKTRGYGGIIEHAVVAELFTFYAFNHEPYMARHCR